MKKNPNLPEDNYEFYTQQGNLLRWKPLFCVPYYSVDLDLTQNDIDLMISEIYSIQKEKKFTQPEEWECSVTTSYSSNTTFPPHTKVFEVFNERVAFALTNYLKDNIDMSILKNRKIDISIWYNIFKNGDRRGKHNHIHNNGVASGILYLKTPEDSGITRWYNPLEKLMMACGCNEKHATQTLDTNHHEDQRPGRLVVFPPYVDHDVSTNNSKEDRVTLSFNVNVR